MNDEQIGKIDLGMAVTIQERDAGDNRGGNPAKDTAAPQTNGAAVDPEEGVAPHLAPAHYGKNAAHKDQQAGARRQCRNGIVGQKQLIQQVIKCAGQAFERCRR